MPPTLLGVDVKLKPWEQSPPMHNRWHPEIPAVATVEPGQVFRVETVDWTGGQIKNDDSADDVKNVDLTQVHYLSGPIAVSTAEPGDLLRVELLNLGALPGDEWGFCGSFHKDNGGGFLCDHYPQATKACWDLEGINCSSRHIPGVKFAGLIHPGLIGTAPSAELLAMWNGKHPHPPFPPSPLTHTHTLRRAACHVEEGTPGAMLGKFGHCTVMAGKDETWDRIASEGARTVPGRENGGNCDIKGGMKLLPAVGPSPLCVNPIFELGPLEPRYSEWLVFEGISVDEKGRQHYLDATLAYKRAVLNAIKYLANFGYTEEQVYLLLSCCPCEGRISGIVDVPNAVATLAIPMAIFDR
ncbi:Acetamidase/Formamidase [Pavlovales sp. CCMP2436]|nr:Acetamidase/Formamidase [Pavlovales sp. CCMP2436]